MPAITMTKAVNTNLKTITGYTGSNLFRLQLCAGKCNVIGRLLSPIKCIHIYCDIITYLSLQNYAPWCKYTPEHLEKKCAEDDLPSEGYPLTGHQFYLILPQKEHGTSFQASGLTQTLF